MEVEVDMAVEVVGLDGGGAEELGNVEVGVGGDGVLEGLPHGMEKGKELRRENVLEDGQ